MVQAKAIKGRGGGPERYKLRYGKKILILVYYAKLIKVSSPPHQTLIHKDNVQIERKRLNAD